VPGQRLYAYVRPLMTSYLSRMESELKRKGFHGSFLMVLSDGALTTLEQAKRFPIRLIEGGPAKGVALAAHVARELQTKKMLSLDIGGTTAKICFIPDGKPQTSRHFEVARAWRDVKGSGLPVKVPTVELVELGAGGGSIAIELVSLSVAARENKACEKTTEKALKTPAPTASSLPTRDLFDQQSRSFKNSAVVPRTQLSAETMPGTSQCAYACSVWCHRT